MGMTQVFRPNSDRPAVAAWPAGVAVAALFWLGGPTGTAQAAQAGPATPVTSAGPSSIGPSRSAADGITITIVQNCLATAVDATIGNGTDAAVTVAVAKITASDDEIGPIIDTVTVGAGATGMLRAQAVFPDSLHLGYVRQDTGALIGTFHTDSWSCPGQADLRIEVISGTTYSSGIVCMRFAGMQPGHGRVEPIPPSLERFAYTPDPGYVGPDQFSYGCAPAAQQFGTVFITVLPGAAQPGPTQSRPAQPGPAQPEAARPAPLPRHPPRQQLPATGPAGLPWQIAAAAGLILAGATATWLSRPRRRRLGRRLR